MSGLKILINGAGIAGPVLAFFLARTGAKITIIEKAPALRTGGQNIDIRGVGLKVVRRMGLEAAVLKRATQEEGVAFVDAFNNRWAEFAVDRSGRNLSMTAETEIMRGDLAEIFYEATREHVEYRFGTTIRGLNEHNDKIVAEFSDDSKREFDIIVAADGLGLPTRALIFGEKTQGVIKPVGQYVAWFSIPREDSDGMWARWYNAPGRRMILLRPDTATKASRITRASIWICTNFAQLQGLLEVEFPGAEGHDARSLQRRWLGSYPCACWDGRRGRLLYARGCASQDGELLVAWQNGSYW